MREDRIPGANAFRATGFLGKPLQPFFGFRIQLDCDRGGFYSEPPPEARLEISP